MMKIRILLKKGDLELMFRILEVYNHMFINSEVLEMRKRKRRIVVQPSIAAPF